VSDIPAPTSPPDDNKTSEEDPHAVDVGDLESAESDEESLEEIGGPTDPEFTREEEKRAHDMSHWVDTDDTRSLQKHLDGGASVDSCLRLHSKPEEGRIHTTILGYACLRGALKCANLLLDNGASVDGSKRRGSSCYTPMQLAVQSERADVITRLLAGGARMGRRALQSGAPMSTQQDHDDVLRILLDQGARFDVPIRMGDRSTTTLLGLASIRGSAKCARLLLERGASPEGQPFDLVVGALSAALHSPLSLAISQGHADIAASLLDYSATLGDQSEHLPDCIERDHGDVLRLLLDRGGISIDQPVKGKHESSISMLELACHSESFRCARALVEAGAEPTEKDCELLPLAGVALDSAELTQRMIDGGAAPLDQLTGDQKMLALNMLLLQALDGTAPLCGEISGFDRLLKSKPQAEIAILTSSTAAAVLTDGLRRATENSNIQRADILLRFGVRPDFSVLGALQDPLSDAQNTIADMCFDAGGWATAVAGPPQRSRAVFTYSLFPATQYVGRGYRRICRNAIAGSHMAARVSAERADLVWRGTCARGAAHRRVQSCG